MIFPAGYQFGEASGRVTFYESGTTTLKNVYSDASLTTPISNPVTLDASGRVGSNVYGSGDYTIELRSASASLVWTRDDCFGWPEDTSSLTYTQGDTGSVSRTVTARLQDHVSVKDFGATGDGVTDDTSAVQAAIDTQKKVYFPAGIYNVTGLTVSDGSQLIGENAYMGIRDHEGRTYDENTHTVIKYTGSSGSNTYVLRCSDVAIGTPISDTTPPDTHDIFDLVIENITVDGNGLADVGIYCYRNIECQFNRVAAMQCTEYGWYIGACFENSWIDCTAFSNEKNGWEIGTAMGGLTATQMRVNGNLFLRPSARYNGTGKTYNETTNAGEGNGFYLHLSAGNDFVHIDSEVNDGAGIFITNDGSSAGGPAMFRGGYLEGNMPDVVSEARGSGAYELYVAYRTNTRHFVFDGVYISGVQDGVLINESGGAPSQGEHYLLFRDCYSGSVQLDIDSNTIGFKVENCSYASGVWSYSSAIPQVQSLSGAGAVNPEVTTTWVNTTGTDALTLADGKEGREKYIVMRTDGGVGTLTPTNLKNGTTITFDDVGDSAHLVFTDGDWVFMGGTATLA